MRSPTDIAKDEVLMSTLAELTSVFEGIASMKIAQIKSQVLQSSQFFNELWNIYSHIDVAATDKFATDQASTKGKSLINKELFIIITSESGFSGDIDQKLIRLMLDSFDEKKNDLIVIGHHGASQLAQLSVPYKRYFKLPTSDYNINVTPLMREVEQYSSTSFFYQEYVSLMYQEVKRISLSKAVQERGQASEAKDMGITERTYIFEPSTYEVAMHLERAMMRIAISQLVFDSKLAQYASRFRAMTSARQRADESKGELKVDYNRSRRAVKDERLKEIVNGLKKTKVGAPI